MKSNLALFLSFLLPLTAFFTNLPLAFSDDLYQVVDADGNPIVSGLTYYILPAVYGPFGGGFKLAQTGNSDCPLTVLQDYSEAFRGLPVKFSSSGTIFTGTHQYFMTFIICVCILLSSFSIDRSVYSFLSLLQTISMFFSIRSTPCLFKFQLKLCLQKTFRFSNEISLFDT